MMVVSIDGGGKSEWVHKFISSLAGLLFFILILPKNYVWGEDLKNYRKRFIGHKHGRISEKEKSYSWNLLSATK